MAKSPVWEAQEADNSQSRQKGSSIGGESPQRVLEGKQPPQLSGRTEAPAGTRQGSLLTPVATNCSPTPPQRVSPPASPRPFPKLRPTSHIKLLFLQISTCSGAMTRPVKGPISVPALIHVLEKMPRPSPGMELWAMITSTGSTRLDSFCTSAGGAGGRRVRGTRSCPRARGPAPRTRSHPAVPARTGGPNPGHCLQRCPVGPRAEEVQPRFVTQDLSVPSEKQAVRSGSFLFLGGQRVSEALTQTLVRSYLPPPAPPSCITSPQAHF